MNRIKRICRGGVRSIRMFLSVIVGIPLSKLKRERGVALLMRLVQLYIKRQSPAEALRFLFALDERLYVLQGRMSVAYGEGIHTKHRHTRYHDFFVNRIKQDEDVLDIGCGVGAVAFDVAEKAGARVVGIDLSKENINIAQQKYSHSNVEYVYGDALTALPERHFNVAILSNVLEHLPDRSNFLRKVVASSEVDRFLIRVPLFERDWRVPLKMELGMEWRLDKTHFVEYTVEQFGQEMEDAGLHITHQEIRWGEIWVEVKPDES